VDEIVIIWLSDGRAWLAARQRIPVARDEDQATEQLASPAGDDRAHQITAVRPIFTCAWVGNRQVIYEMDAKTFDGADGAAGSLKLSRAARVCQFTHHASWPPDRTHSDLL
jgi:hypothetical protein